ncbi:uroporphyrinogen-III synthase [Chungangia koreensis]|uniref:Uroporphyrinogen-III synthase n=1 Tax=Chungangia koreensis TaxID=752657 RepID=A0ABV8X5J2_9LACT
MCESTALKGETIILTGIPKSDEPERLVRQYGGEPVSFPLIRVQERADEDLQFIHRLNEYDWLIFTSQNGVKYFGQKLVRFNIAVNDVNHPKIAAVGSETEKALKEIGFQVHFKPSVFSADRFVVEFPDLADAGERCLFLRGSLAKETIKEGLINEVDEWTVYETVTDSEGPKKLIEFLAHTPKCTITFSSPSCVEVFVTEVIPHIVLEGYTIAAIGHVTEDALLTAGLPVHVKPEKYTMTSMIEKIAKLKGDSK